MISLLTNAAKNSLRYRKELAIVKAQNIDIENFNSLQLVYEEFISIPNYAAAHNMTEDEVMKAIDDGKLQYRKHVMHGKLYIHKDEILF